MLLRSSSSPILNSWSPQSKPSSESDQLHHLPRAKSISFHLQSSPSDDFSLKSAQYSPESETTNPRKPIRVPRSCKIQTVSKENGIAVRDNECLVQTLVVGGGVGNGGGRKCGGGGGEDGDRSNNHGSNSTDAYYLKMIEANPGSSLLLGNYAKFLKEVRGDLVRAEEYCARAILANPNDGDALSLYADIIWNTQKDAQRAESYFDQAVKTAPDDCYLLASYARFLWDTDVDEEDDKEAEEVCHLHPVSHMELLTTLL